MADRSSKRQRELLSFVDSFIKGNGYGPSYREIMRALGYKSVSTVAVHIDNLIAKGYLIKRDHSARSLEVVTTDITAGNNLISPTEASHREWLLAKVLKKLNRQKELTSAQIDEYKTLVEALKLLDLEIEYKKAQLQLERLLGED